MAVLVASRGRATPAPTSRSSRAAWWSARRGPWGEASAKFADLLKERTQGRINVKNYYAGQLFAGKQTNEFTLLNQGVADFAFGSTINWSPQVKELNLFFMPFLVPSYKAQDAIQAGEAGKKLLQLMESKGVMPLAWGENGFRQVTNSKRAIKTPGDLDGLKIRTTSSPIFIDIFRAMGANPVNMNWGEAQTAFQQGTVDGQENPVVSVIIPSKLWTSQKHITFWNYVIDPLVLGMSKLTWDSLTAEDKAIVKKTAEEVMAWQKKGSRARAGGFERGHRDPEEERHGGHGPVAPRRSRRSRPRPSRCTTSGPTRSARTWSRPPRRPWRGRSSRTARRGPPAARRAGGPGALDWGRYEARCRASGGRPPGLPHGGDDDGGVRQRRHPLFDSVLLGLHRGDRGEPVRLAHAPGDGHRLPRGLPPGIQLHRGPLPRRRCSASTIWLAALLGVVLFGFLIYFGIGQIRSERMLGTTSESLAIPQWWYTAGIPVIRAADHRPDPRGSDRRPIGRCGG